MVQKIPASGLESAGGAFKNLVINGDMKVAQRATSATTITNNSIHYATVDRWFVYEYSDGVLTSEQHDMSAADQATTGQTKAMELNVTTADSSIASGQWCFFAQAVEAQFCQHALYGTSAAKDLTLSFYVKSNKTGTYAVMLDKNDSTRYRLPITYTIDSADTWEKKVIHFSPTAGSTSLITGANGAIDDDNGIGFFVWWILAAGTDYHGTNNTWTSSGHYTTSDQVNWLDSTSNNFHITGVQLEIGSGASDFEHLPFDVNLQRCMRYCQKWELNTGMPALGRTISSNRVDAFWRPYIPFRAAVSAITDDLTGTNIYYDGGLYSSLTQTATALVHADIGNFGVRKTFSDTISANKIANFQFDGQLIAEAEL
jgi:hypothetical protein